GLVVVPAKPGDAHSNPVTVQRAIESGVDSVQISLTRNGQQMLGTATLAVRPCETSPLADVLYRTVSVRGARRRVIVTRPKDSRRHPAVLIMGGLGCYSLDGADPKTGYGRVIAVLQQENFVTMRVEKTGEGDSEGPACTDARATAELEASGYAAALDALRSYDFVDPKEIFVFAHSLGPLLASLALPGE